MLSVSAFSDFMTQRMGAIGLSNSALARRLGCAHSFIWHMLRDERRPPLDQLDAWAKALEIPDDQCKRFDLLARLAHCPPSVETEYLRMMDQIRDLTNRLALQDSQKTTEELQRMVAEVDDGYG
jgi:transcriptional regulator with XRE-family HTH domain